MDELYTKQINLIKNMLGEPNETGQKLTEEQINDIIKEIKLLSDMYLDTETPEGKEKVKREDEESYKKTMMCKIFNYYVPPILEQNDRKIVVIGDIHGDYGYFMACLEAGGLIEPMIKIDLALNLSEPVDALVELCVDFRYRRVKWIGGNTYVVLTGDLHDSTSNKLEQVTSIYRTIADLHFQSRKTDGLIITLLGNHELLNLSGEYFYNSEAEYRDFTPAEIMKKYKRQQMSGGKNSENGITKIFNQTSHFALSSFKNNIKGGVLGDKETTEKKNLSYGIHPDGTPGEMRNIIGCTSLPMVIIGNYLFVHADISILLFDNEPNRLLNIKNREDLYILSRMIREWILNASANPEIHRAMNETMKLTSSFAKLFTYSSFFNSRKIAYAEQDQCAEISNFLKILLVNNVIIGHTPSEGISSKCKNKVIQVDTGFYSRYRTTGEYAYNENKHNCYGYFNYEPHSVEDNKLLFKSNNRQETYDDLPEPIETKYPAILEITRTGKFLVKKKNIFHFMCLKRRYFLKKVDDEEVKRLFKETDYIFETYELNQNGVSVKIGSF
jgi:hypothetical protein